MSKTIIIAEAGVNHNGDLETAKKLISVAADCGADFVKFQTFKTENLVTCDAQKAAYQSRNTNDPETSQFGMLKKLEMPAGWYPQLIAFAASRKIQFLSTGFDEQSIDFLDKLGLPFFKIPSGEITNKPFLEHIARKKKPVILSTGMATLQEVKAAVKVLTHNGLAKDDITVLHCTTEYPAPMASVNLKAMLTMRDELHLKVGYSDHTLGIEITVAAVALGAAVIEKHFTLDKKLPGPDHAASLEPEELKQMVAAIRNVELAMAATGKKEPASAEIKNINVARKSLYYKTELPAKHTITRHDLVALRPGDGISPMEIDTVTGKPLQTSVKAGEKVSVSHF